MKLELLTMNRPFTFYPNSLSLGPVSAAQSPSSNIEWRLIFKDQFDKFSHSLEIQLQQQLQNYTSAVEIMLGQQGVLFQQKLDDLQQFFSQQLLHNQSMVLDSLNKQNSNIQSEKENLNNALQKIENLHTMMKNQSEDISKFWNEFKEFADASRITEVRPIACESVVCHFTCSNFTELCEYIKVFSSLNAYSAQVEFLL